MMFAYSVFTIGKNDLSLKLIRQLLDRMCKSFSVILLHTDLCLINNGRENHSISHFNQLQCHVLLKKKKAEKTFFSFS